MDDTSLSQLSYENTPSPHTHTPTHTPTPSTRTLPTHTHRTAIAVIELLAAVCLVKGGHIKIMESVDNFKKENNEQYRFETLFHYFMEPTASGEFHVACMTFINVFVHSAEDMNFRVHLQHEFTLLGLDDFIEVRFAAVYIRPFSGCVLNFMTGFEL